MQRSAIRGTFIAQPSRIPLRSIQATLADEILFLKQPIARQAGLHKTSPWPPRRSRRNPSVVARMQRSGIRGTFVAQPSRIPLRSIQATFCCGSGALAANLQHAVGRNNRRALRRMKATRCSVQQTPQILEHQEQVIRIGRAGLEFPGLAPAPRRIILGVHQQAANAGDVGGLGRA